MDAMGHMSMSSGLGNRGNDFFDRPNMDSSGGGGGFSGGGGSGIGEGINLGIGGLVPMGSAGSIFDIHGAWYRVAKDMKNAKANFLNAFPMISAFLNSPSPNTLSSGNGDEESFPTPNVGITNMMTDGEMSFKPDDDIKVNGVLYSHTAAYSLRKGEHWAHSIDGFAQSNRPGEVFKMSNIAAATGVFVYNNYVAFSSQAGSNLDISITVRMLDKLLPSIVPTYRNKEISFDRIGGGWKDASFIQTLHERKDYQWDNLYFSYLR